MARTSTFEGKQRETDEQGRELLSLIDDTISSIGKDLDRYYLKERDLYSFRFIVVFILFAIYAAISLIFLQVTIDGGVQAVGNIVPGQFSSRIILGTFIVVLGAPIAVTQILRARELAKAMKSIRRSVEIQAGFGEEVLVRVSNWERNFRSHEYYYPILKLKIAMLSQLVSEMREIAKVRSVGSIFTFDGR